MQTTILQIEDNEEIASWLNEFLTEQGYKVIWLKSGMPALDHIIEADLIILDIMLPGLDGYTIGQRLKNKHPDKPILMLTARSSIEDKLQGLSFADDYMTKPYHPDELVARIQILLRRTGTISNDIVQVGHLRIDRTSNRIMNTNTNQNIALTGKQFHIFMYLLDHSNQILTQRQIYEAVWEEPFIKGDRTLMVHIRHLREKIEINPGQPKIIDTIRGIGYRLNQ